MPPPHEHASMSNIKAINKIGAKSPTQPQLG